MQFGYRDARLPADDARGVAGFDAFVLGRNRRPTRAVVMFLGWIDHGLELPEGEEAVFVDDDGFGP